MEALLAIQLLITLALSLACALYGNHAGAMMLATWNGDLLDAMDAFLQALLAAADDLLANPLRISTADYAVIGTLLAFIVPWCVWLLLQDALKRRERLGQEHGSAKAADKRELKKFATAKNPDPDNVLILSENYGLAVSRLGFDQQHDRNLNVVVIGGSGSGKTRYFVKPNLMQLYGNYFVTDPKFTIPDETLQMFVENGYDYAIFNTNLTDRSFVYNPLEYLHTDLEISEWVDGFLAMTKDQQKSGGDQFWDDSTNLLLSALIAYLRDWCPRSDYNLGGVLTLLDMADVQEGNDSYKSPLDKVFQEIETGYTVSRENPNPTNEVIDASRRDVAPNDARAKPKGEPCMRVNNTTGRRPGDVRVDGSGRQYRGLSANEDYSLYLYKAFKKAAGKTLKSILISVAVKMKTIVTEEVKQLVCGPDEMHLERLADPDDKYVVFDAFKDTNTQTLGFLHGMLVWQTITVLCKEADSNGGKLKRPVQLLLDEFKTLNLPKNIADMISVIRSRNVGMCIILQSLEQLYQMYDEHCANGLVGCCDTMLYLGGGDNATNKQMSDSMGQETVHTATQSVSHQGLGHGSWSEAEQVFGRAFMDQAEVGKIPRDECIVMIKGTDPAVDKKYYLYDHHRAQSIDPGHGRPWTGPWRRDFEQVDTTTVVRLGPIRIPTGAVKKRLMDVFLRPFKGKPALHDSPIDLRELFEERREERKRARAASADPRSAERARLGRIMRELKRQKAAKLAEEERQAREGSGS